MVWNPESTSVWNPESRRLESGIQRIEIQNPDAGIRNLEAGIRNPGLSWILLHRARNMSHRFSESLHFQQRRVLPRILCVRPVVQLLPTPKQYLLEPAWDP